MKERIICIYCMENKITKKKYIGQTRDYDRRVKHHLKYYENENNVYLSRSIDKYGIDAFEIYILEKCSIEELNEKEKYYINLYKTTQRDFGYNILEGGNTPPSFLGKTHSEETKQKISEKSKGNQHWLGKSHSEETKQKMSEAQKGKFVSESTRKKISQKSMGNTKWLGKHHSEESKIKISIAHLGKKQSPELVQKRVSKIIGLKRTEEQNESSSRRMQGRRQAVSKTSQYIGVSFRKRDNVWVAQISFRNKKLWIGQYKTEIEAAIHYDKKALELYGNDAKINFPKENNDAIG